MPAGRPPKPAVIKLLEGNRSRREVPEEAPAVGTPSPPDDLDDVALEHWHFVVRNVLAWGLVGEIDGEALGAMCRDYSLMLEAHKAAKAMPTHKDVRIAYLGYRTAWGKAAQQFGMDPVSRAKLAIAEQKRDELDEFVG